MTNTGNRWKHTVLVVRMIKVRKAWQSSQGKVWEETGVTVVTLRRAVPECRVRRYRLDQ